MHCSFTAALQSYVRREDKAELVEDLRNVFSPEDASNTKEEAHQALIDLSDKWIKKYKSLSNYILKLEWQPYFTYLDYSVKIKWMIYTTNWIERFNRSMWRTLKVRGTFPNEERVLALITSVSIDKSSKTYAYPINNFSFEPKLFIKQ